MSAPLKLINYNIHPPRAQLRMSAFVRFGYPVIYINQLVDPHDLTVLPPTLTAGNTLLLTFLSFSSTTIAPPSLFVLLAYLPMLCLVRTPRLQRQR